MTRFGVAHRLTAGLLAITLMTGLATGLALYGIERFRSGFDRIAVGRIGNLVAVARVAQQAQAIAVTAPRLVATGDRFERERAIRHLDDLMAQLAILFQDLRPDELEAGAVAGLDRYRQEFVDNVDRLDRLVGDRHAAERQLRRHLEAIDAVTRDARAAAAAMLADTDRRLAEGGEAGALYAEQRALLDWQTGLYDGATAALVAASTPADVAVDRLTQTFRAAMRRATDALPRLPGERVPALKALGERMTALADGDDGVFATRRGLLGVQRQTQGTLQRITIVSSQFVASASNLFVDARTLIEQERTSFARLMDDGAELLAGFVVVGLVVSGLVFADLRRRVIRRLLDLQRCMRARADGQPVPIPVGGNDELADIAHAFAFFAGEIERREAEANAARTAAESALSELRAAQDQLVATEKMAALGGLVAGVAHEINTPIGVALTGASYLLDRTDDLRLAVRENRLKRSDLERYADQVNDASRRILSNIERAVSLIQSFKQVAADQTSGDRRRFALGRYIGDVVASLEPRLRSADVSVAIDCPDDIEIDNYPGALSQVLTNLIMNSLTHAYDGTPGGTLDIVAKADGEALDLEFRDYGCGIAPDVQPRIFDPFFTTKRGAGGTGLGLHIVHNIVSKTFGGRIAVTSAPGVGTSFSIRMPCTAPAAD